MVPIRSMDSYGWLPKTFRLTDFIVTAAPLQDASRACTT